MLDEIDGGAWQVYVDQLLILHYQMAGEVYQCIPDEARGDHGLEGFSTVTGHGYQSYSDQGSLNLNERTRKQKRKISNDLKKLEKHSEWWQATLGDCRLTRWTLVVPNLADCDVVQYARTKAADLKAKNLLFIGTEFYGTVCTADQFPKAKALQADPGCVRAALDVPEVTPEQIEAWRASQTQFMQNLDRKIAKLIPSGTANAKNEKKDQYLSWYLKSSNYLEELHNKFPPLWEQIDQLIATTAEAIATDAAIVQPDTAKLLKDVKNDFNEKLKSTAAFANDSERTMLTYGSIAKWLGQCHLDFLEAVNGN